MKGVFLGDDESVLKLDSWLYNTVNVLNATELYTLKWLILSCVNFSSIF